MNIGLISDIKEYKNYFLVISGIYGNLQLSVLDSTLKIVGEFSFGDISIWKSDFHIDEENNKILISVTTTDHYPFAGSSYQGFSTTWFIVEERNEKFSFKKSHTCKQSEITRIRSKKINGLRHWICLKQLISISENGRIIAGAAHQIGVFQSKDSLEIPEFRLFIEIPNHIKIDFDFYPIEDKIALTAILALSWSKPTILLLNPNNKTVELQDLAIPLKKLHHFEGCKLINLGTKLYGYYWITSHEYSKKYKFEMYKVSINHSDIANSKSEKLNNEDFIHNVKWSEENRLCYKKIFKENKAYVSDIDSEGNEHEKYIIENQIPIMITRNNSIITKDTDEKILSILKIRTET